MSQKSLDITQSDISHNLKHFLGENEHFDDLPSVMFVTEMHKGILIKNIPYEIYNKDDKGSHYMPYGVERVILDFLNRDLDQLTEIDYKDI